MSTFDGAQVQADSHVGDCIQVILKPGWHLVARDGCFVSQAGESISFEVVLPHGTQVVYLAPSLAHAQGNDLTEEERYLARHLQVVFSSPCELHRFASGLEKLEAVEEVRFPCPMALPIDAVD